MEIFCLLRLGNNLSIFMLMRMIQKIGRNSEGREKGNEGVKSLRG